MAVFSDVHGNLPALEAVISDMAGHRLDEVFHLGDLVGYGPFPNEVINLGKTKGIPGVMGNYDDGVGFERDDCGCAYREEAQTARAPLSKLDESPRHKGEQGVPKKPAT